MKVIMDQTQLERTLKRMAHELIEKAPALDQMVFVPILEKGLAIARSLKKNILIFEGIDVPIIPVDITYYRDDKRAIGEPFKDDLTGKKVVIIDDVLYTGRSVRAALDALMDAGRPEAIMLATLIDRGHRELPIRPDVVGKNMPTRKNEKVVVNMRSQIVTLEDQKNELT